MCSVWGCRLERMRLPAWIAYGCRQRFLVGHTAPVCALSAAVSSTLVASAQEGALGLVRLWDRATCTPLALLQVPQKPYATVSAYQ